MRLGSMLATVALVLAACGGSGQTAPSDSPHDASSAPSAPVSESPEREASSERLTAHPRDERGAPLGFYEYLPPGDGSGEPPPLLVFVHGLGQSGDGTARGLDALVATGIPQLVHNDMWPASRPFVVLAPQHDAPSDEAHYQQCEEGPTWGPCVLAIQHELGHPQDGSLCMTATELHDFIAWAIDSYEVDPERVYLTGLSCGAFASFEYVAEYGAAQIAAMVVIAGDGRPAWAAAGCELGQVAIWGFHGDADEDITHAGTVDPITSLQECPEPPRREVALTVYSGADHDSWTQTYDLSAGHDIYEWLLRYTRP